jgi:hypothetical protein
MVSGKIGKIGKIDGNPAFRDDRCLRHGMGGGNGDPRLLSRANGHAANLNWHNNLLVTTRRFPPPWSVEELDACFVVRDSGRLDGEGTNHTHRLLFARTHDQGDW